LLPGWPAGQDGIVQCPAPAGCNQQAQVVFVMVSRL
jgi:hypothetical protein